MVESELYETNMLTMMQNETRKEQISRRFANSFYSEFAFFGRRKSIQFNHAFF